MRRIDRILNKLDGVKKVGKQWKAKCPAHDDGSPSLYLSETPDERILIHCHAGCAPNDILGAIGLSLSDLYPERLSDYLPAIRHSTGRGADLEFERQYYLECKHRLRTRQPLTDAEVARMKLAIKRLRAAA